MDPCDGAVGVLRVLCSTRTWYVMHKLVDVMMHGSTRKGKMHICLSVLVCGRPTLKYYGYMYATRSLIAYRFHLFINCQLAYVLHLSTLG